MTKKEKYLGYQPTEKTEKLNPPEGGTNVSSVKIEKVGCPVCGDSEHLVPQGRCVICTSCGWNMCNL